MCKVKHAGTHADSVGEDVTPISYTHSVIPNFSGLTMLSYTVDVNELGCNSGFHQQRAHSPQTSASSSMVSLLSPCFSPFPA